MAPLPNHKLPLADQLTTLLERSQAGDSVATCRLIISLQRCKEEQRNEESTQRWIRSMMAEKRISEATIQSMNARSEQTRAARGHYCKDVDTRSLPQPDEIIAKSLHALSPRQKTILALTRSDGSLRRLRQHRSFGASALYVFPQYLADHTVDFLMEGYRARDPLALEGLVMLHAPSAAISPSGIGVWLPDARLFIKYSLLMVELYGAEALGPHASTLIHNAAAIVPPAELTKIQRGTYLEAKQWRKNFERMRSLSTIGSAAESQKDLTECEDVAF